MKKVLASSVVVLMVLFLSAGLGLARNGGGGNGTGGGGTCDGTGGGGSCVGGSCGGTGISLVCSGVPTAVEGTVATESYLGSGLQIDTGSGVMVVIYGIGPYWYWENAGVARPSIGEAVTIDAMEVTFSDGTTRIIAMSIDVEGVSLQLREACVDDVGGWPLWRGGRNNP